jgi:hypothetical protein
MLRERLDHSHIRCGAGLGEHGDVPWMGYGYRFCGTSGDPTATTLFTQPRALLASTVVLGTGKQLPERGLGNCSPSSFQALPIIAATANASPTTAHGASAASHVKFGIPLRVGQ